MLCSVITVCSGGKPTRYFIYHSTIPCVYYYAPYTWQYFDRKWATSIVTVPFPPTTQVRTVNSNNNAHKLTMLQTEQHPHTTVSNCFSSYVEKKTQMLLWNRHTQYLVFGVHNFCDIMSQPSAIG